MDKRDMMVRVCDECGTVYSEKTKRCENCGARLGEPIDNDAAMDRSDDIREENDKRRKVMNDPRNRGVVGEDIDPGIEVTPARIVCAVLAVLTAVAQIGLIILFSAIANKGMLHENALNGESGLFMGAIGIILILAYVVADCLFPNQMWRIGVAFRSLHYKGDLYPSDFGKAAMVVADYFMTFLFLALTVVEYIVLIGAVQ